MSKVIEKMVGVNIEGEVHDLPVITGTHNEKGIDISKLRGSTGYVTLDPGFKNTGSTRSAITFLDGEKGILHYRGYPIEQLAQQASFLEVVYLLLHRELPDSNQLNDFVSNIQSNMDLPAGCKAVLDSLDDNTHPMAMLTVLYTSLSGFYSNSKDASEDINNLIAKMPALAAYIYRRCKKLDYLEPKSGASYTDNFLHMMFGDVDPVISEALNTLLILHADHEQNCSASTVRIVGSAHTNIYGSIAAGNAALWGPLHGGANQKVIEMLEAIRADGGDTAKYIAKAKDKNDPFRLMGFGHRVYKNFDPRAQIIKKYCDQILDKLNIDDPILDIAKGLEQTALSDEYFVARKLFPNVDFYSGIIYRALGIPVNMFTVMFSFGRLPGWIAQWKEMLEDKTPIGRPRQIYTGYAAREYVSIDKR